ncbi:MAG TPA: hypothetical protein VGP87_10385 [Gemmatimonadales bacterium]|nr:hypothetical protein [Gemmatimonadales bacterium]
MTEPAAAPEPAPPPPVTPPHRHWYMRWKVIVAAVILSPLLLFALYTFTALHVSYSEGQRAGYLQKFSRKGWLCKTWEGELAVTSVPGVAPTIWTFSVRDAATARQMNLAAGRRVVLYYEEHRGVPTNCFGDTNYFVDSLHIMK